MTLFGIDRLLAEPELRRPLEGKRVAILAHPASVTRDLTHSVDALAAAGLKLTAAFGPPTSPIQSITSRCSACTVKSVVRQGNRWERLIRS